MEILKNTPLNLDAKEIASKLHIQREEKSDLSQMLLDIALPLITPKSIYKVSYIDKKTEDAVVIPAIVPTIITPTVVIPKSI